jgi:lipopolysaccharide transport system ATP-binding protein
VSDVAIQVEGLSKQYRIGGPQARYKTLRESVVSAAQAPIRRAGRLLRGEAATDHQETIWALKDVSFEVKRGEVVGIIGRNGAGKTTLLKVLSRITEPTEGGADVYGRVGSLLEVGTGFHPELTGRENIYLNGAILGMGRAEIEAKFDEIVAFAEVERFIETPVKHYSSGMYVRLAFAVAAHLEPEILLVDEVLAVGDAGFQKKCLGKMGEVAKGGRTVLFVSHNMAAIESLCTRCAWLDGGRLVDEGQPATVVSRYLDQLKVTNEATTTGVRTDRLGSGEGRFTRVRLLDEHGRETTQVAMERPVSIEADYQISEPISRPVFGFLIANPLGSVVFRAYSYESYPGDAPTLSQAGTVRCYFDPLPLMYGTYHVHLWLSRHRYPVDYLEYAMSFEILRSDVYGTGRAPDAENGGVCFVQHRWEFPE